MTPVAGYNFSMLRKEELLVT